MQILAKEGRGLSNECIMLNRIQGDVKITHLTSNKWRSNLTVDYSSALKICAPKLRSAVETCRRGRQ
jgi:hypothetical protein